MSGDPLKSITHDFIQNLTQHIEEYAAAYLKKTNIPPDEAVMNVACEYENGHFVQKIWFTQREEKTWKER